MADIDFTRKIPGRLNEFRHFYRQSLDQGDLFWAQQARRLLWHKDFVTVVKEDFSRPEAAWFCEGHLNATQNALHRIIDQGKGDGTALTFYPDTGSVTRYTFSELKTQVEQLAAAFAREGLGMGDRIVLHLPNSPDFVICALAAAFLGITYLPMGCHLPASLVAEDVKASGARLVIMFHEPVCGGDIPCAETLDALIQPLNLITVGHKLGDHPTLEEYVQGADPDGLEPVYPPSDHPLFAMYENRLTRQTIGTVFATGGFLTQAHASFDAIFNATLTFDRPQSIFNTLDVSRVASQAYGLWGPLTLGAGIVMADTIRPVRTLQKVLSDEERVAMLCRPNLLSEVKKQQGTDGLDTDHRFSVIACCGDPLPPRLVRFADQTLVDAPERVVNMWVEGKSGTALIHSYPTAALNRPGALGFGALGVEPKVMDDFGRYCKTNVGGNLVFARSWPAMARAVDGSEALFKKMYFSRFEGHLHTSDGLRFDKDGFFWFMGRLDDVIKIKGQSIATSLIESVLTSHPLVADAAIISSHVEEDEGLVAFVVTAKPVGNETRFIEAINAYIAEKIGYFAVPEKLVVARQLPRTSSGKLVRGLLKRIATGQVGENEDVSHLANANMIQDLFKNN